MSAISSRTRASPSRDGISNEPRFTNFSSLPQELRIKIWEASMPGPRIVSISQRRLAMTVGDWEKKYNNEWPPYIGDDPQTAWKRGFHRQCAKESSRLSDKHDYRNAHLIGWQCNTPLPEVFLACREAYSTFSQHYKCTFAAINSQPETYFNFKTDTLLVEEYSLIFVRKVPSDLVDPPDNFWLDEWNGFREEDANDRAKVERLVLRLQQPGPFENAVYIDSEDVANLLMAFRGVKTLTLINHSYNNKAFPYAEQAEFGMVEVIDVDDAISTYQDFINNPKDECGRAYREDGIITMLVQMFISEELWDISGGEMEQLRALQEQDETWNIPEIEEKIMVPPKIKERYEAAKRNCQILVNELQGRVHEERAGGKCTLTPALMGK